MYHILLTLFWVATFNAVIIAVQGMAALINKS